MQNLYIYPLKFKNQTRKLDLSYVALSGPSYSLILSEK